MNRVALTLLGLSAACGAPRMIRRFFNRFRKRPPLNEDWKPGDLAECIATGWNFPGPDKGDVLTVRDVIAGHFEDGSPAWGLLFKAWEHSFNANLFRKVHPISDAEREAFKRRLKAPETVYIKGAL